MASGSGTALLHFRIKRGTETIFMLVEPSDSFGKLKAQVRLQCAGKETRAEIEGLSFAQTAKLLDKATDDPQLIGPDRVSMIVCWMLVQESAL